MSLSFNPFAAKMDILRLNKFIPTMTIVSSLLAAQAHGHMIMANPVPYGYQTIDNSPLTSSNYPCKVTSDPATFYSQDGIDNTYAAGSVQTLSFKGSAVHGGGSCQLAVTSDMQPSAETDWRVILSIESGCPSTDGTSVGTYNWTVPEDLAAGQYSFAWTWISKLAGQPEYYMNCAPITVTSSSSSKRSGELVTRADDYPELFVANLDSVNSCKTSPGTDVVYPDPGPNVEKLLTGATPSFASVSQDGCVPMSQSQGSSSLPTATAGGSSSDGGSSAGSSAAGAAVTTSSSSGGGGGGGVFATTTVTEPSSTTSTTLVTNTRTGGDSSTSTSADLSVYVSPVVQSSSSKQAATSSSPAAATTTTTASSTTSSAGFATGGSGGGSAVTTTTSSAEVSSSTSGEATTTSSSGSIVSSSATSSSATATATGSGSSGGNSTSSGSASQKSGTCSDEGTFNCVGDQYQQCASGAWTSMRDLPSGTTCQQGESTDLWARGVSGDAPSRKNANLLRRVRRGAFGVAGRLRQG